MNYEEARAYHFKKRLQSLKEMYYQRNPLSFLNTALLDGDKARITEIKGEIEKLAINYSIKDISQTIKNKSRLKMIYLIPHSGITGGIKILIEQANRMAEKGHEVVLFSHCPRPSWIACNVPFIQVAPELNLSDVAPKSDVVIAGYWDSVVDALNIDAPLKYHFAQGDFDIHEFENLEPEMQKVVATAYTLPLRILTVSNMMKHRLASLFSRHSTIIPNAIDLKNFHPRRNTKNNHETPNILLVGSDTIMFKGHESIIKALINLKGRGYRFNLHWVTPCKLHEDYRAMGLEVKEYIAPLQGEIADIYRSSDYYICGSYYESFSLPSIEAMACGAAVITSDNGGVRDYTVDEYNCLIYTPGDSAQLASKLEKLFQKPELRELIVKNGLSTAKKYTWTRSINCLERALKPAAELTLQAFLL